jgi:hypothetical protein
MKAYEFSIGYDEDDKEYTGIINLRDDNKSLVVMLDDEKCREFLEYNRYKLLTTAETPLWGDGITYPKNEGKKDEPEIKDSGDVQSDTNLTDGSDSTADADFP